MARSVRANYFFNLLNSGSQLLFPLITFPYATRIVMAEGIGQVSFFSSIITYISLFTCLGIPLYAIREIARVRGDLQKMTNTTVEILLLHAGLTMIGYIVVGILCLTVEKVQADIPLFLLLSATIFFTAIGCDWFYRGIEDFKYVAIKGLSFRIISAAMLFVLVKSKDDILLYGAYTVLGSVGGNIFNVLRLRKYIKRQFIAWHDLRPMRHLKPVLHVFVFNVVSSIYIQLNTILFGFFKDAASVGYFITATKIMTLTMSVSNSLGNVMLPHASNLIAEKKLDEFKKLIQKSYDFILFIALPLMVGLIFTSKSVILLLAGSEYVPSIVASQIVAPILVFAGISNVLGMQILYPMGQINKVIWCTIIGALVNILLNCILIPSFGLNGTAVAYMMAELSVTVSMFFIGRKYIPLTYVKWKYINYVLASALMGVCLYIIAGWQLGNVATLLSMVCCGVVVYVGLLLLLRDELCQYAVSVVRKKLLKR